jgi:hypothetical protein
MKPDTVLRPCLEIGHNIFGNKNNVPGTANELVFLGIQLWSDKRKQCGAIRRSNRHPSPDRYMRISNRVESELINVESKTSIHVRNENDMGVNAKVGTSRSGGKGDQFGSWGGGELPISVIIRPKPLDSDSALFRSNGTIVGKPPAIR